MPLRPKEGGFSDDFLDCCVLVTGRSSGRTRADQINYYHNKGNQSLPFSSVGGLVYRKANS